MKRLRMLRGLPRATVLLFGASGAAVALAVTLMFTPGSKGTNGVAEAHIFPEGCDPGIGAAAAIIDAPGTVPPVVEGQNINYRLRVNYPADSDGVGCQAFNIDVWIKLPGEPTYVIACNIATLDEGQTKQCPDLVPYTAQGADRTAGNILQAFLYAIGDKHDQPDECITSPDNPNAGLGPTCWGAQQTSNIGMPSTPTPTPTQTPTSTPTGTPTNTPTSTNTPVTPGNTPTNTPERETSQTPTNPPPRFTPTAPPSTPPPPTPINTTLPATVAPQPTNTPVAGVVLPPAGGGGPMGDLTTPIAALAFLALVFAGAGIIVAKREGV